MFNSCALWREESSRERLAKIPSLPLLLSIVLFQSLPKIHIYWWVSEQTPISTAESYSMYESSGFVTIGGINLTQCCVWFTIAVYQFLCSSFYHSWMPPEVFECLDLLCRVLLLPFCFINYLFSLLLCLIFFDHTEFP